MGKNISNGTVTISFDEDEFSTLSLLADKLNLNIADVVRGLVPRFPESQILRNWVLEANAKSAHLEKPYKIREGYDAKRIKEICNELISNRKGKTLATEIMTQLIEDDHPRETLTQTTAKRLLRWAHPARVDARTRFVTPRAREMCKILFGAIPNRTDLFFYKEK